MAAQGAYIVALKLYEKSAEVRNVTAAAAVCSCGREVLQQLHASLQRDGREQCTVLYVTSAALLPDCVVLANIGLS
jgi:hypothetical protein